MNVVFEIFITVNVAMSSTTHFPPLITHTQSAIDCRWTIFPMEITRWIGAFESASSSSNFCVAFGYVFWASRTKLNLESFESAATIVLSWTAMTSWRNVATITDGGLIELLMHTWWIFTCISLCRFTMRCIIDNTEILCFKTNDWSCGYEMAYQRTTASN